MADHRHFDHTDREGRGPGDRLDEAGIPVVTAGENLHRNSFVGDIERACRTAVWGYGGRGGWANSTSGHCELMLGLRPGSMEPVPFSHAAVGAATDGRNWYIGMYVVRF